MIGKLTGRQGGLMRDGSLIVDVAGVGYAVRVPLAATLGGAEGSSLTLYIHTAVREDAIDLYGFPTEEELAFFKLLTSVSGVGPKTALGILNVADVPSLKRAVAAGDASVLSRVYGIGKKSAERIVVELRDKLAKEASLRGTAHEGSTDAEVIEALEALGYTLQESRAALKGAPTGGDMRERLAAALKSLGSVNAK